VVCTVRAFRTSCACDLIWFSINTRAVTRPDVYSWPHLPPDVRSRVREETLLVVRAAHRARKFSEEALPQILEPTIFSLPETSEELLALPGVTASRVEGTRVVNNVVLDKLGACEHYSSSASLPKSGAKWWNYAVSTLMAGFPRNFERAARGPDAQSQSAAAGPSSG